jgi:hypothetical protein
MTKTMEDYFELYRQKLQQVALHKQNVDNIKESAEAALRHESAAVEKLKQELLSMQRTITLVVESGKDLTEILLAESENDSFVITLWDHDNPLANDTQIDYTATQLDDLKYRLRKSASVF